MAHRGDRIVDELLRTVGCRKVGDDRRGGVAKDLDGIFEPILVASTDRHFDAVCDERLGRSEPKAGRSGGDGRLPTRNSEIHGADHRPLR